MNYLENDIKPKKGDWVFAIDSSFPIGSKMPILKVRQRPIENIDKTPPTLIVAPEKGSVASGSKIKIEAKDESGILSFGYYWDGANAWTKVNGTQVEVAVPEVTANTTKILYVYAIDNSSNKNSTESKPFTYNITAGNDTSEFKDVPKTYWAYEEIMGMVKAGILCGYPDGTFKPENPVTRAEFAKIMVLALKITLTNPEKETFVDLPRSHWAYQYVEPAKGYLTGYKTSAGMKFKPDENAVREDVAVALVKAKGYQNDEVNESEIYKIFRDADKISPALRKYVLIAQKRGLINGYPDGTFGPQKTLTRAEAAKLLWQIVQKDEKIIIN
jgi:hypothetical protein